MQPQWPPRVWELLCLPKEMLLLFTYFLRHSLRCSSGSSPSPLLVSCLSLPSVKCHLWMCWSTGMKFFLWNLMWISVNMCFGMWLSLVPACLGNARQNIWILLCMLNTCIGHAYCVLCVTLCVLFCVFVNCGVLYVAIEVLQMLTTCAVCVCWVGVLSCILYFGYLCCMLVYCIYLGHVVC